MKVKTHVKLGELCLLKSNIDLPKGFSRFMFNFGLVMIDQSWHVKTHPHYMQKSLSYINEKIKKLSTQNLNTYNSMQLGIIVHYLCDFCCKPHKSGAAGNVVYHIKYEHDLQKYLLNNFDLIKNQVINDSSYSSLPISNFSSLKDNIDTILSDYINGEESYLWDILNSIKISSLVCSYIFNTSANYTIAVKQPNKLLQLSN
ncbi:zinc dependent phospholipase C family protein [Inconstantimicrobium mannanitabidum]|uniref:Uncharacterized protein n=1 Tax=Inconstantimicrobium mannanitabidum TaxID=1604901 RepID=A0ACB5RAB8_9CLOT|nr:zinc dependent phospholipase C family protein [Clostridium sp. TW13]GKX65974.1 hypothetical protein rsdtw13_12320 [Clostridium sp. TW13]